MKQQRCISHLSQAMFVFVWHVFLRQNLEQCWRAELWSAAGETEGPPAQGQGGGMFLWRHDCPQYPHGHETPGIGRRVPTHRQVSGATKFTYTVLCWAVVYCHTYTVQGFPRNILIWLRCVNGSLISSVFSVSLAQFMEIEYDRISKNSNSVGSQAAIFKLCEQMERQSCGSALFSKITLLWEQLMIMNT